MGNRKGHIVSKETRRKISIANIGKKCSEAARQKISEAKKGKPSWNKDKKGIYSEETKKKMSEAKKGKPSWNKGTKGNIPWNKGTKGVMRAWNKGTKDLQVAWNKDKKYPQFSGANSGSWKGGITPENVKIRTSLEMNLWRKANMERDNFTCQICGIRGGELVVHHINNFAEFPELRTSIENGTTFCKQCHSDFHKEYGRRNNTKEQINDFLGG